ncbi:MAG: glutamate-5-semialdehyde dehydrogenase [Lachnospiraceae bacterium]|nr:glutamate-5-semialdehyde dehydrogenase [Lachnospiraceae bacterium]
MNLEKELLQMKSASPSMAASTLSMRNQTLLALADSLRSHAEEIFAANRQDLAAAQRDKLSPALLSRLKFDEQKLQTSISGLESLSALPDPTGRVLLKRELDRGLVLTKVTVPIGVIGIIFEARPDAMIQVASLCIKSGNCAVLKGGKESLHTNRLLFSLIYDCALKCGLPPACLLHATEHAQIAELLSFDHLVDLLIPRGSNAFVRYIMDHTNIPVMGHAGGVCHIYVDRDADQASALPVILDAKTQYPAACNAVETLLIHRDLASTFLPAVTQLLRTSGVQIRGTREVMELLAGSDIMEDADFTTEYNDRILSIKLVSGVEEAVLHINTYGSHHTDAILTENDKTAEYFLQMVDSAGVYRNCSTRFADGYRYGFGAEVGIATGKLHARGPVGLDGLVTYKYRLIGEGQTVTEYASGEKQFHHRDLPV